MRADPLPPSAPADDGATVAAAPGTAPPRVAAPAAPTTTSQPIDGVPDVVGDHREETRTMDEHHDDRPVTLTRGQLDALLARIDRLEAERSAPAERAPERAVAPAPPAAGPATPAAAEPEPAPIRVGRRRAIAGLAGAAAGTVASLASTGTPAAAADGDPLELGATTTATSPTQLTYTGGPTTFGVGVIDGSTSEVASGAALYGHAKGTSFDHAVQAIAEGANVDAVNARSEAGHGAFIVSDSSSHAGVLAIGAPGLEAAGAQGQVRMLPETPPPVAFPNARTGTLYVQAGQDEESFIDGTVWACVEDGTPGVWRKLAGHDTAGALHILPSPRRVYDSRPGAAPSAVGPKTPLPAGNVARTLDLTAAASGVPAGATGALVTVLLVDAAVGAGNVTIWANDRPKPVANTLVWGGDARRFTTLAVTAVDSLARVKVDASLQTNLVLDVVGYFR